MEWSRLSLATRKQREAIFIHVLKEIGTKPHTVVTPKSMRASFDRRKATPFQAKNFLDAMRGLFRWAFEAQHVGADPTEGIKAIKPQTDGFKVWSEDDVSRFEARWAIGTRERLAFDLLLYTGLRRGDVARLGRQHVKDGLITLRTDKTGQGRRSADPAAACHQHRCNTHRRSRLHCDCDRSADGEGRLR